MTPIKSEKAEEYINIHYGFLTSKSAKNAVIIAETEAEELHAKQLQELNRILFEVSDILRICDNTLSGATGLDDSIPKQSSLQRRLTKSRQYILQFTQKLNEK